jgi:transposase
MRPIRRRRLYEISSGQLYTSRKQFRPGELTGFVPVSIAPESGRLQGREPITPSSEAATAGVIEVALPTGVNYGSAARQRLRLA